MGTDVGLDKYDSYKVIKFRFDEKQPGTISSNNVRCIFEDREKKLWIGTADGLNLYDPMKGSFKIFKNNPADKNSINDNLITGILEDKKGNLWFASGGNCLNKWVPQSQNFINYLFEDKKNDLTLRPARMIANDSKGFIWIITIGRGIIRFDPETGIFTKYDDPSIDFGTNCYKSLFVDDQDKIWITSDGNGFFSYDPAANKFEKFGAKGDGKGTNLNMLLDVIGEDDRYLLLAVDQGGINRFNKVSKTFEYIMYDETNDEGLNSNGIWCFHKDREGILWIGTSGGGINYYNPKKENFKLFKHSNNNPHSLSFNFTGCFYEDHQGMIWVGTDGGGVNIYNPKTSNFIIYKHDPSDPYSISGNVIRSIAEDKDHDIWIATWGAGLNRYDRKTGRFFRYMPEKNNSSSISGNTIWNLRIDQNDIVWLCIYNVGVDLFDKRKGVIKRYRANADNPRTISSKTNSLIYKDSEKNMWICTGDGLNRYEGKTDSFKIYNFPDNVVLSFCKDKDGNWWVGTDTKGVYFCKPDGTIVNSYNTTNGLPNNSIKAIIEDNHGDLWFSTNGGISRFDRKTQKFRNYSKEDGLQGNQFFAQSFLKTRKGEIYFGGFDGFNSFYPDSLEDNELVPPVYITDFQISNKPVVYGVPGSQFQTHISGGKEITLLWNQSVFSFEFAAINFNHPEKNQYAYMMEGFEKEWNYTNASRRYVTYTNLDPGDYTFKVKASNNDGVWNEKGTSLKIIILPPWWQTLWFRFILLAVLVGIVFWIYKWRVQARDFLAQKRMDAALTKERNLLRTLIDNIPDAIYVKDIDSRKTIANFADVHNMHLHSEAEVLGKNDFELFPKELAEGFFTDDQSIIQTGQPVMNREENVIDEQGQKRWLLTTKLPLRDEKGQIIGLVGVGRDITEQKKAEAERERLITELQDALADVKLLSGLVPICANCKKIRDDQGYWTQIESYIQDRSDAKFSHSICPDCAAKLYPNYNFKK
jgi:PAS domain S-box-containing protein